MPFRREGIGTATFGAEAVRPVPAGAGAVVFEVEACVWAVEEAAGVDAVEFPNEKLGFAGPAALAPGWVALGALVVAEAVAGAVVPELAGLPNEKPPVVAGFPEVFSVAGLPNENPPVVAGLSEVVSEAGLPKENAPPEAGLAAVLSAAGLGAPKLKPPAVGVGAAVAAVG